MSISIHVENMGENGPIGQDWVEILDIVVFGSEWHKVWQNTYPYTNPYATFQLLLYSLMNGSNPM